MKKMKILDVCDWKKSGNVDVLVQLASAGSQYDNEILQLWSLSQKELEASLRPVEIVSGCPWYLHLEREKEILIAPVGQVLLDCDRDALLLRVLYLIDAECERHCQRTIFCPTNFRVRKGIFDAADEWQPYGEETLIPCVCLSKGKVIMVAYMNRAAFYATKERKLAYFYSRSKKRMWMKGEQSGNLMEIGFMMWSESYDAIALEVLNEPVACHEGYESCFFREIGRDGKLKIVCDRIFDPKEVYKK